MTKRPITNQIEALFEKADKVKETYKDAKKKALVEINEHANAIQELDAEAKELHKMYTLSEVTLETYEEAKDNSDRKRNMLTTAEEKVNNLDVLMNEELINIYRQIKRLEKAFQEENTINIAEQRKVMFQAKVDYLKAIHEAGNKVKETDKHERNIYDLGVELGQRKDSGFDYTDKRVYELVYNSYNGQAGLDTFRNEIAEAYHKGVISNKILKEADLV